MAFAQLPEVAAAILTRGVALGNVEYDEATNEPVIGLAIPSIAPSTGELEGILVAKARFRRVWEMTAAQPGLSDLRAYILDNRGHVIAHANPSVVLSKTTVIPSPLDGLSPGLSGERSLVATESLVIGNRRFVVVVEQLLVP
ncbi:MAG: cache domain-containing protein, partial [Rhodospirillaceae bacterium]|nr:cache domain-containing protein [Rhodospirillaceae bacterium]